MLKVGDLAMVITERPNGLTNTETYGGRWCDF